MHPIPSDMEAPCDPDEARKALRIIVPPGKTFEIRSLPSGKSWVGTDHEQAIASLQWMGTGSGTYIMLNPVRPDLTGAASNKDILERNWLLVDIDSSRPDVDVCANEEEKQDAFSLAKLIMQELSVCGFPDPVVLDSGNGYHLLYHVELPNNDLSSQWVKALLKQLAASYNGLSNGKVDTGVHNAGRLGRLPGTWNRKGPSTPDRPHRMARIVRMPEPLSSVPIGLLQSLCVKTADPAPRLAEWTIPNRLESGEAAAWFRKAVEGEAGKVALSNPGERHNALRAAVRTLAGYLHLGVISEADIVRQLTEIGARNGLPEKEIADVIRWGLEDGKANPLPWPAKLNKPQLPPTTTYAPATPSEKTTGDSGREYKFPLIVKGSSVKPKKVSWLWPDRIPFGFLTLMAGRTGVGKSFVTLDIAARITAGEEIPFHGGECFEPSDVLIISEDSHDYILTPRLLEAGANMDRINYMSWEAMASYTLADTQMLHDVYEAANRPRFVVIDPPTNFLGDKDEHRNAEVRSTLMLVSIWAMQLDVAVVMITHCNKGVKKDMAALDRVIGSVAWASTSRIAHLFAPDPDVHKQGVFLPLKSNISETPNGLSYVIEKTDTLARVRWLGKTDFEADDAMSGEKKKPRGVAAIEWLAEQFTIQRSWDSKELKDLAAEAGISKNALWSPEALALPIRKAKRMTADGEQRWTWTAEDGWPPCMKAKAEPVCMEKPINATQVDPELSKALRYLAAWLMRKNPSPCQKILEQAKEDGITETVMREAATTLGVSRTITEGVEIWSTLCSLS